MDRHPNARFRLVGTLAVLGIVATAWVLASTPARFVAALGATYLGAWALLGLNASWSARGFLLRAITANGVALLCLALLELPAVLRVVDYRVALRTPILSPARNPAYRIDPELVFVRAPDQRLSGRTSGDIAYVFDVPDAELHPYDLTYDGDGFRNPEAPDAVDIAVLGDSFVEATLVSDADLFTTRLAELQQRSTVNLGQIQYGPQQELAVLRRYALPRRPEVVIWVFFEGNDLGDALLYDRIMADFDGWVGARHSLWQRSFTKNTLQLVMRLVGEPREPAAPRSGLWSGPGGEERVYFLYPAEPLDDDDEVALEVVETALHRAAEASAGAGAHLVVAYAPSKFRVMGGATRFDEGSLPARWVANDLPTRMRDLVRGLGEGVTFVDLTPPLEAAVRSGTATYLRDDSHWSAAGHRVVAEVLDGVLDSLAASPAPDGVGR